MKKINNKFALASLTILATAALTGALAGIANAVGPATTDQISNGEVTIYAQQAAPTGANQMGPNDGSATTSTGTLTMANVTFTATQITPVGSASVATIDPTNPSTYTTVGSPITQKTDSTGMADFTGLTDGNWLFQQITTVGGITTVAPFVVTVNSSDSAAGDVNVYPKLDMQKSSGIFDIATTNADSNYNSTGTPNAIAAPNASASSSTTAGTDTNTADASNTTTAGNGNIVAFNVNTVFDQSQISNTTDPATDNPASQYIITDVIPSALTVNLGGIVVSDGTQSLTPTTDYTTNNSGGTVTVTLTAAGQAKVNADLIAASATSLNLNTYIPTTVPDGTVGSFSDSATSTITNAYGVSLGVTDPAVTTVNVGGLDFTKTDGTNPITTADAQFVLVKADSMADAQALVTANASYFNNTAQTGNPTTMSSSTAAFVMNTAGAIQSTTINASGVGSFTGLNLVDNNTDSTNQQNYFVVEVKAPTGYQLPTVSTGANVFGAELANTAPQASDNSITNNKPFALPFTGGMGVIAIVLIASAAGIGAIAIRRRKDEDEKE